MKPDCTQITSVRLITFSENKSKLTLINVDRVVASRIKVDGCQITNGIRCDYLLIAKDIEHFIELKGQDINHAIEQIISTIKTLSSNIAKNTKVSYVICTRSPLTSASIQNLQLKFKKHYNSKLIIKSSPLESTI